MRKILPLLLSIFTLSAFAQITVNQADYGSAGDSLLTATDTSMNGISVGGTGMQTWNYGNLDVNSVDALKFELPSNTASGAGFPNSDLAIERQDDTLFFKSSASALTIDGIAGDAFNLGQSLIADFNPDATQITYPSTFNTSFTDTAVFDTVVSCAVVGQAGFCDSAHLRRRVIITSVVDAYGDITTPGGTYTTIRQYYREDNKDSLAILLPIVNIWQTLVDSLSTVHNYRWIANNEDWPVMAAIAESQGGDMIEATYKVDENLIGLVDSENDPACNGECTGSITVSALGGLPPYSYIWSNGATTATAGSLCAGTYTVTVSDGAAGSDTLTVTLTEPTAIVVTGAVQNVSVGGDGAIQPSASGGAGDFNYSWTGPDGYSSTDKNITGLDTGLYVLTVSDGNGCTVQEDFLLMLTGISNVAKSDIRVYPNPAAETLFIEGDDAFDGVVIYNLLGKPVLQIRETGQRQQLDLHRLAPGIYTVVVDAGGEAFYARITVER